ncbi:hypothetical protein [Acetobacter conturbans]|uniref:Phage protein n=1 Tax=Acetobacter conturbans TaxID=1737472 RepID=A0ABX0JZF9_9PROT|nr:hypothetical protein [Acetobacter conturbans]NHN88861.1 hypothetical protein [Acetobacter conturbans]
MDKKNIEINCESGKKLTFREITPGEMLDLILACGAEGARNDAYLSVVQQWCSIRAINNIPIPFPTNKQSIRDLADELGNDGIEALEKYFDTSESPALIDEIESIKN